MSDTIRLQRQIDDLHGAARRLLYALADEPDNVKQLVSGKTASAAQEMARLIERQDAEDTAIMVKVGKVIE